MATDVLIVEESYRLTLDRNGKELYTQYHTNTADETYTRHASDRLVLAAGMSSFQQINLGDIGVSNPGEHLLLISDRSITIAVNDTTTYVDGSMLALSGAAITALYVKNTDANNTATIEFVVTD